MKARTRTQRSHWTKACRSLRQNACRLSAAAACGLAAFTLAAAETNDVRDIGQPGGRHQYFVPLNRTVPLVFSVELKSQKDLATDANAVRIGENHWAEAGLAAKLGEVKRTETPIRFPVWQVDGRGLPENVRKGLISTTVAGKQVKWSQDGMGVIRSMTSSLGHEEESIGALNPEEFLKRWGGGRMVYHLPATAGKGTAYDLPVVQGTSTRTEHLLTFTLEVTTPAQQPDGMGKEVKLIVQGNRIAWGITARYNNLSRGFGVTGPYAKSAAQISPPATKPAGAEKR